MGTIFVPGPHLRGEVNSTFSSAKALKQSLQHLSSSFVETATISAWFASGSVLDCLNSFRIGLDLVFRENNDAFVDLGCTTGSQLQYSGD